MEKRSLWSKCCVGVYEKYRSYIGMVWRIHCKCCGILNNSSINQFQPSATFLIFALYISTFHSPLQPYVKANIFPLIYRGSNDPDRVKAGLAQTPISHFTQMVHADTEKVNDISKSKCYLIKLSSFGTHLRTMIFHQYFTDRMWIC